MITFKPDLVYSNTQIFWTYIISYVNLSFKFELIVANGQNEVNALAYVGRDKKVDILHMHIGV